MTPAEAPPLEDPRLGDVIGLLGWPWKLALALLLISPAILLLDPWISSPRPMQLLLGSLAAAALLALTAAPWALTRLLAAEASAAPPAITVASDDTLLPALRRLLEEQQRHVQDTTAVVGRAVTAGAQLSSLAHAAEQRLQAADQRLKTTLERAAAPVPPTAAADAARLDAALDRLDALNPALQSLPGMTEALQAQIDSLGGISRDLAGSTLPATADRLADSAERIDMALRHRPTADSTATATPPAEAPAAADPAAADPVAADWLLQRMEQAVQSLASHADRITRGEAQLGDAAGYLTETTDRFADTHAKLETELVRLQAMLSIAGQRQAETAPLLEALAALERQIDAAGRLGDALDHTQQHITEALAASAEAAACRPAAFWPDMVVPGETLSARQRLDRMETGTARILDEAKALAQGPLQPEALAAEGPDLLRSVEHSIHRLTAAASVLSRSGHAA